MSSDEDIYEMFRQMRKERNASLPDDDKKKNITLEGSSLKKYTSVIKSIHKAVFPDLPMSSSTFTENVDKVVEFLKDKPPSTRRHQYNSLRVFTNNDKYGLLMKKDNETYTKQMNERNRTAKQEENWISRDDVNTTLATLKVKRDEIYEKVKQKVPLQMNDYQTLQSYLLLLLSSDQHFPIRRTMDWTNFKIKDIDIQEDNYMTDEMLVFNKYKTSKTKGQQRLEFSNYKTKANSLTTYPSWDFYTKKGAALIKRELKRWVKINPTDYLFFDKNKNQLNQVNITHKFNKIFESYNKNVSINMLRNILATSRDGKVLNALANSKRAMEGGGSSANMLKVYVKNLLE